MAMEALRVAAKESKVLKFILGGFIFLAVGGLVFTDVRGYFSGGAVGTTVARAGDTKIDIREFDGELRNFLSQTGLTTEQAYQAGVIHNLLNQKIANVLQLEEAQELDIRLDNKEIAKKIRAIFGENATKDQIEMTLRAQGLSEQRMADIIQLQTLSDFANNLPRVVSDYVPSYVSEAQALLNAEKRSGVAYTVSIKNLVDQVEINDADIADYYTNNIGEFTTPESRQFTIATMTAAMAKKSLPKITDADVKQYYDDNKEDFLVKEKRSLAQAIVKDTDQAQAVYEAAMNGAPLTKALNNVIGNKDGFRDVADYELKGLPAELADIAFGSQVKKGDVLPPVKTLVGYSIMKVTNIKPETYQSYGSVKSELKKDLQANAVYDALYNKMVDVEDMLDNGEGFSSIVEKGGFKTKDVKTVTLAEAAFADSKLKSILENSSPLLEELFALSENGATYPVELNDDEFVVVGVRSIMPAVEVPLDDVSLDIKKTLIKQRQSALAESEASNLVAQLNDGNALPNDLKAKKKSIKNIARTDNKNEYKDLLYSLSNGEYTYKVRDKDIVFVGLNDISFSKTKTDDVKTDSLRATQNALINRLSTNFWKDEKTVRINEPLLQQTYAPNAE